MTLSVPTCEPDVITPGSAWSWDPTYSNHPADESWQLNYFLRGLDGTLVFTFAWGTHVSAGDGAGFEVRVTAAQSGALKLRGGYQLVGQVSKAGDPFDGRVVYNAHVLALTNPTASLVASEIVGRSDNRRILDALLSATLEEIGGRTLYKALSVNGRSVEYLTPDEHAQQVAHYTLLVAQEDYPDGVVQDAGYFVNA